MKITNEVENIPKRGKTNKIFVDGVLVVKTRIFHEWFCTIKKGTPSNIRDKVKKAKETNWSRTGLEKVLGTSNFTISSKQTADFVDSYPDTTWGGVGYIVSKSKVKELITEFIKNNS